MRRSVKPAAAAFGLAVAAPWVPSATAQGDGHSKEIEHDPRVRLLDEHDSGVFRPDPAYDITFRYADQIRTYGDKHPVKTQRPLLEWGRALYQEGPFQPGGTMFGDMNLTAPHLMIFGDLRMAAGYNDSGDVDVGRAAARLNLDVDFKITATERIHALFRPIDQGGRFTGFDFAGDFDGEEEFEFDGNVDALFFEGDAGAIHTGIKGTDAGYDLPFTFGLIPLLFQNGVWVEDAFTGFAFTIPAQNSPRFDISNYDVTFFAGFDKVTSQGVIQGGGNDHDAAIFGATAFLEAMRGYWEVGYGYTAAEDAASDLDYHNVTAAFTKRYGAWLSNSVRGIVNFGQDPDGGAPETADGVLLLVENSLVTSKPSTLIPYMNFFASEGTPQSLARDVGAGGVLKNTGINFEADAITAFPSLDATGHDAVGAAFGVEYLFGLDKQVVLEVAGQHPHGDDAKALGDELALGLRIQIPLNNAWILRFDAMVASIEDGEDRAGARVELRWKF